MHRWAHLSPDGKHRLALQRIWGPDGEKPRLVMFVGLNPSTADARVDDPTLRRCIGFAKAWGFDGLYMANLFSLRSPYPRDLLADEQPTHPDTDIWLTAMRYQSDLCVAAWGQHAIAKQRERHVRDLLDDLHVLGLCADGSPRHPLYMRGDTVATRWATL